MTDETTIPAPDAPDDHAAESAAPQDGVSDEDLLDDQADAAEDFVNGLLDVIGFDGDAEADFGDDDLIIVNVSGPDMAVLIGRHGATLEALQDLTRAAVQHATQERAFLMVDIEGYRERQRERIESQAIRAAERVTSSGRPTRLEPMTSYERKIVHDTLAEFAGVQTVSEGEEPERCIVIRPA